MRGRVLKRLGQLHKREDNVMKQIRPVLETGEYRMKVARQWVTLFEWGDKGNEAVVTGIRYRGDKNCYK